jgi:metal-responsive CopG/Arc/MetJ family transcriptional regulator
MQSTVISLRIPQRLLYKLEELTIKDFKANNRNEFIKNILFKYVEEVENEK